MAVNVIDNSWAQLPAADEQKMGGHLRTLVSWMQDGEKELFAANAISQEAEEKALYGRISSSFPMNVCSARSWTTFTRFSPTRRTLGVTVTRWAAL